MNFRNVPIHPLLNSVVRSCWILEGMPVAGSQFRTMADGCPGLIYQPASEGSFQQNNKQLPELFIFGQTTRHAEIDLSGKFATIGLYLYPHALTSIFGCNPGELTDSCFNINLLAKKKGFNLTERLANAGAVEDKVEMISSFLCNQVNTNNRSPNAAMQFALEQIIQSSGSVSLKQLQKTLQLSERSFQRNFKQYIGISPMLFSRICRFQASLKQLQEAGYNKLSDIAFDNDYADQSHFIRAFKEFAGVSPNQYQKQTTAVVENLAEIIF
ncbi:MAG: helix-turn-helix domain-containing protein [Ferruginibacter sp.]